MSLSSEQATNGRPDADLKDRYRRVRQQSLYLCESLQTEDFVAQSMPDVSPTKWHLAHTSWFFENFLLVPHLSGYRQFDERFDYLFNSYYYTVGQMHLRSQRGLLTRPTVREVRAYREHVDAQMDRLLDGAAGTRLDHLLTLGLNHEQQHQELMLTDIKHVLSVNPLQPAYRDDLATPAGVAGPLDWHGFPEGVHEIGTGGDSGFCFDNETPRHRIFLRPFALASRPVTNAEYREFIEDGGYRDVAGWLSDGWAWIRREQIDRPLYWSADLESEFTLGGFRAIDPHAPVSHLSFYEADAYARRAGHRLPTEAEWEIAAAGQEVGGNLADTELLHPAPAASDSGLRQMYGDVWEWTASPYASYPGFQPLAGSLGEYNGKFMCNQMVLRGGSCATPADHIRATYRNFFYPESRWQFSGLRLAKDA
ncbi:MAG: ergothioneine biosynthesis protein EgtB [Chromatiales bacterium]|jgi:ergothioneine biosynthesis protein EgtB|nr:ergothioneine biosynthesis protein EgtB [Chromatiales bacterium]